jgi:glycosyltransferase involved in cell wall biosynthesis
VIPLRLWLAERVYTSPTLAGLYARHLVRRAGRAWRRSAPWPAAEALLRAWKHAGEAALGAKGAALWQEMLARLRSPTGRVLPLAQNPFLAGFVESDAGRAIRARFASYPLADRVRLRLPRPDAPADRPGDLLVLKPFDPATGDRGVLLVTYHAGIEALPAVYDLAALAARYQIVLEPSTWGYMDARFLPYVGSDLDVLVQAQHPDDFAFVEGLGVNLTPTRVGAGDWVDPAVFAPDPRAQRSVDVVMVAAWDPLKRHALLLDAVASLKQRGHFVRTLLIGYPWTWKRAHVERLVRRRGLGGLVSIEERVPHAEMPARLANARLSVLLSRREGANRAIYESWFCDTPTLVTLGHRGVNPEHAESPASHAVADDALADAIFEVLHGARRFAPRAWALEATGHRVAGARVEAALRELAARRGRPSSRSLAPRSVSGLLRGTDRALHDAEVERLEPFLRRT